MNDSTQYHFEGKEPKRKSKLPLILLIIAVILGVVIWRFKSAGKPVESAVPPTDTTSMAAPAPDTLKQDTTPAAPAAVAPTPKPEAIAPAASEKPAPVAKHHKVKTEAPVSEPAVASAPEPKPAPKSKPSKPVQPTVQVPSSVSAEASKEPVVAPAPVKAEAKPPATPKEPVAAPAQPAKKFALEDQPMPEKSAISDESRVAMTTLPKAVEAPSEAAAASPTASEAFKQGEEAYHKQDYATAIKVLGGLPKPTTKQRGNSTRDEYVEGHFLLGLSYLRADKANDAVAAFLTVLDYEKYYPLANMNLGICYVELKQYFKANKAFEAVVRDQGYIDASMYDDVMQRTKYFWAIAWTRMFKTSKDADKQAYYQQQAIQRWKDYQTWFGKNTKYRAENRKAEDYIKSLSAM